MPSVLGLSAGNTLLLFIACGIAMSLYWERESVQEFASELRSILSGDGVVRRKRRLLLILIVSLTACGMTWIILSSGG